MTIMISPDLWPLWIGAALLLFSGVYHHITDRVPNWIAVITLIGALLVALMSSVGLVETGGTLGSTVVGLLIGFGLLMLKYAAGQIGAGTVKMHGAYCAWVGCAMPTPQAICTAVFASVAVILLLLLLRGWFTLRPPAAAGDAAGFETPPIETVPFQLAAAVTAILGTVLAAVLGILS